MIKRQLQQSLAEMILGLSRSRVGSYVFERIVNSVMSQRKVVARGPHRLTFATPNKLTLYRVETFESKEPDTLAWIDSIPEGSVIWDVGANIGLYAVYAAKARNCDVYAFEPSVFNLELLARNIDLNGLHTRIGIVPFALTDRVGMNAFRMTTTVWGGALSTFGETYDQHGAPLREVFEYQSLGISVDDVVNLAGIPRPDYLKIDVDGIEHLVLRGANRALQVVKGVLIEIDDGFREQSDESVSVLKGAGLVLHKKCDLGLPTSFNQWWSRPKGVEPDLVWPST